MSAPNFYARNAKRLFVHDTDECCIDEDFELCELEDLAREKGWSSTLNTILEGDARRIANKGHGDYYATLIPYFFSQRAKDCFDGEWRVTIVPLIRSGYYAGGCLDYFVMVEDPTGVELYDEDVYNSKSVHETMTEYLDYLRDYEEREVGTCAIMSLGELFMTALGAAENKFYEFAEATGWDELICKGIASNGEAFYINKSELERAEQKKG